MGAVEDDLAGSEDRGVFAFRVRGATGRGVSVRVSERPRDGPSTLGRTSDLGDRMSADGTPVEEGFEGVSRAAESWPVPRGRDGINERCSLSARASFVTSDLTNASDFFLASC